MAVGKRLAFGKKAFFFTFLSLMIIGVFLLAMRPQAETSAVNKVPVIESRVMMANDFVSDLRTDYFERVATVAAKKAMITYIDELGTSFADAGYIDDLEGLILTGYLDSDDKMSPDSVSSLITSIETMAEENLGLKEVSIGFRVPPGEDIIMQDDTTGPWTFGVILNFTYNVSAEVATWNSSAEVFAMVKIDGMKDLYTFAETSGQIDRNIYGSSIEKWQSIQNLTDLLDEQDYTYDEKAPSFLDRLQGDTDPSSCCGIESFVYQDDGFKDGGELDGFYNRSFVDFCYFDSPAVCGGNVLEVVTISTDAPDGDAGTTYDYPFRIDPYHAAKYNLTATLPGTELYKD